MSIKILVAALALVVAGLFAYDLELKAAYLKGDFKKPFGDFMTANFSNFNSIKLESGTAINLMVAKGPYRVLIDPSAEDFVKISQQGSKLIIRAEFDDHYRSRANDYTVFVSCPDLSVFTSDAKYTVGGWKVTDTLPNIFDKKPTQITGFNSERLEIIEDNGSNILLQNDRISNLKAVVGSGYKAASIITIGRGNIFEAADFQILNKGTLNIEAPSGNNTSYHIADSAKLSINGAISKRLFKTIQP